MISMYPTRSAHDLLPELFGEFFENNSFSRNFTATAPSMNIYEDKSGYTIEIAAAGLSKDDLKISIEKDNTLSISLEKKEDKKDEKTTAETMKPLYHLHQFTISSFRKLYSLPEDVDQDRISAKMQDGLLTVSLPKKVIPAFEPRQISIC